MFSLQAKLWEYQWSSVGFWERRREERRGKIIGKQKVRENLPKQRKGMWEQDLWRGEAKVQQWVVKRDGIGLNLEDSRYF